jgi:hypothetical protein
MEIVAVGGLQESRRAEQVVPARGFRDLTRERLVRD